MTKGLALSSERCTLASLEYVLHDRLARSKLITPPLAVALISWACAGEAVSASALGDLVVTTELSHSLSSRVICLKELTDVLRELYRALFRDVCPLR